MIIFFRIVLSLLLVGVIYGMGSAVLAHATLLACVSACAFSYAVRENMWTVGWVAIVGIFTDVALGAVIGVHAAVFVACGLIFLFVVTTFLSLHGGRVLFLLACAVIVSLLMTILVEYFMYGLSSSLAYVATWIVPCIVSMLLFPIVLGAARQSEYFFDRLRSARDLNKHY